MIGRLSHLICVANSMEIHFNQKPYQIDTINHNASLYISIPFDSVFVHRDSREK